MTGAGIRGAALASQVSPTRHVHSFDRMPTRQLKASAAPLRGHKLLSQPDPETLAPWCWQQTGLRAAEAWYKARDTSLGEPEPASSSLLKACSLGVLNGLCTHFLSRGAMVPVNRHLNVTDLGGVGWVMVPACLHASSRDFPSGFFFPTPVASSHAVWQLAARLGLHLWQSGSHSMAACVSLTSAMASLAQLCTPAHLAL